MVRVIVCPFLIIVPLAIDWLFTFPTPTRLTFNPLLSNKYTASFAPIPITLGTKFCILLRLSRTTACGAEWVFPQTSLPESAILPCTLIWLKIVWEQLTQNFACSSEKIETS